jgi:hypothetical protein
MTHTGTAPSHDWRGDRRDGVSVKKRRDSDIDDDQLPLAIPDEN